MPSEFTLRGIPLTVVSRPPLVRVTPLIAISPPLSTVSTWPSVVMTVVIGIIGGKGTVLVPMTSTSEPTLIGTPLTVIAGVPSLKVVPATATCQTPLIVYVWPSVVKIECAGSFKGAIIMPLMRDFGGFDEVDVPIIVIPGPPADTVVPTIANPVGFTVKDWPPILKIDDCVGLAKAAVVPPRTNFPDGPRLTGVPDNNTAGPPADKVVRAMANAVGFGVKAWPPTVKMDDGDLANVVVILPMTRTPDTPRMTGVPAKSTVGLPVVPAIASPVFCASKLRPPAVMIAGCAGAAPAVTAMIRLPDVPRLTTVPEMVTSGSPPFIGVPAMLNDSALAVTVCPATVIFLPGPGLNWFPCGLLPT